jgi:uncharacterized protein YcbK (DUF882 family)
MDPPNGPGDNEMIAKNLALASAVWLALAAAPGAAQAKGATSSESCLPSVLKTRLAQVRSKFGRLTVVSTHRPGAKINGSGKSSFHSSCRAVDFVPPSGAYSKVTRWLYANHEGGVGTYTCMNHIHLDNGANVRWSKCR